MFSANTGRHTFLLAHCRIPRVGKGTRLSITESSDIILVPAEVLRHSPDQIRPQNQDRLGSNGRVLLT